MGNLPGVPPGLVGAFPSAAAVGAMPSILGPTGAPGIPGGSAALDPATIAAAVAAAGNAGLAVASHAAPGVAIPQGMPIQDGTQANAVEGEARHEGDGSMAAAAVAALDPVAAAVAAAGLAPPAAALVAPLPPRPVPVGEDGEPLPAAEVVLRHCLGSPRVRRWCMYEFHYSALDRPWFLRNELLVRSGEAPLLQALPAVVILVLHRMRVLLGWAPANGNVVACFVRAGVLHPHAAAHHQAHQAGMVGVAQRAGPAAAAVTGVPARGAHAARGLQVCLDLILIQAPNRADKSAHTGRGTSTCLRT